jgi:hypothetical protein
MNKKSSYAIMLAVASALVLMMGPMLLQGASAQRQDAIEIADQAVHETFPPEEGQQVSEEDVLFHQALCQVGITTEALEELGGCDVLPPLA